MTEENIKRMWDIDQKAQQYLKRWSLSDETCFSDNGESFCTSELMEIYAQQERERAVSEFKERLIKSLKDDWCIEDTYEDAINRIEKLK